MSGLRSEEKIDSRLTAGVPLTSQEHYDLALAAREAA